MQEIIRLITEAEQRAAEIKADALKRAAEIAEDADRRAADREKLAEADCKAAREKIIKDAEAEADRLYAEAITVNRAKAAKYCADRLKDTDKTVSEIVRRITRGSR